MERPPITPDDLFERARRVGSPFARRPAGRQIGIFVILCFLAACIWGYWYLTDSQRVRRLAEQYIQQAIGGRVSIRRASLSFFEGLRLDHVVVRTLDDAPDSEVFSAGTIVVKFRLAALLTGRLEATQVITHDARIRFCEDLDHPAAPWNHQRLWPRTVPTTETTTRKPEGKPPLLPEFVLRSAEWEYSRIKNGRYYTVGSAALDGRLTPMPESNRYAFDLSGRPPGQAIGPSLIGQVDLGSRQVVAEIHDLELNPVVQAMFPALAESFIITRQLRGRISVPKFQYVPGDAPGKDAFNIEISLDKVNLSVLPEELMDPPQARRVRFIRAGLAGASAAGLYLAPQVDELERLLMPPPIRLGQVDGKIVLTQKGIKLENITGSAENNRFSISGRVDGYSPSAAIDLDVIARRITIPPNPQYLPSMPSLVQEVYRRLRPQGTCSASVHISRTRPDSPVHAEGEVRVLDGAFVFDKFPYPLHHVKGQVRFGTDQSSGPDWVRLRRLRGHGPAGTPNALANVTINGKIKPLTEDNDINFNISGTNVTLDPPLRGALPPESQQAIRMFDPAGKGFMPYAHGSFTCHFRRPGGPVPYYYSDVDIDIDDAAGALTYFPYPMEHVSGRLLIRRDHVQIVGATMKRGEASLVVNGRVGFSDQSEIAPDLTLDGRNVPIDKMLLDALPSSRRQWLQKSGLTGKIDIAGRIFGPRSNTNPDIEWDLALKLHDGSIWPVEGVYALTNMEGPMRLDSRYLRIEQMRGKRGAADVAVSAFFDGEAENPLVSLRAQGTGVAMDRALYRMLPPLAQIAWQQLQPEGTIDADLALGQAVGQQKREVVASAPTTAPAEYRLVLQPRKLSATLKGVPYRLDEVAGTIVVTPQACQLIGITGRHGPATISIDGAGTPVGSADLSAAAPDLWSLRVKGQDLSVDDSLKRASPPALASLFDALKVQGKLSFDCPQFTYRPSPPAGSATQSLASGDIDFQTRITLVDGTLDAGMPLTAVTGTLDLTGQARGGILGKLAGSMDVPSLKLAGRSLNRLRADLSKPADQEAMQITKLQGELAGGKFAGQIDMRIPSNGVSSYAITAAIQEADVRELAQETDVKAQGTVSASVNLEGVWGQPNRRRGRGDVRVQGKELYHIPLVLGLLEITNLSLPISGPFSDASARYAVEGQRVTFEQIELRSNNMSMTGDGWLDFGTRKVKMTFTTDNPNGLKLPFLTDLWQGARHEFLQIHVNGTVQAPQVTASALNTFTTTVDEVFKGSTTPNKPVPKKPK